MTIDKSGQFWKGTDERGLDEYVKELAAGGYPVHRTVHSRCAACGGTQFSLRVDDVEGYAERRCLGCGGFFEMLDSKLRVSDADPGDCACPCGADRQRSGPALSGHPRRVRRPAC